MTFPRPDRSQSCEEVLTGVVAVLGALHEHLGGDAQSRRFFCYAVGRALAEISGVSPSQRSTKSDHLEANIVSSMVAEIIIGRARAEREAERAAAELERETRKVVHLRRVQKRINDGFGHTTGGGGRGPNEAA
jgi:cytochrome P450